VLNLGYNFFSRLPDFKGKAKIESLLRRQRAPQVSKIARGLLMELDLEEWLQIDLHRTGLLEPRTSALFERVLQAGDTYVDVGAHVGYHSLLARQLVGPTGHIYAIDPQPYNCGKILTNAELNGFRNLVVVAAAVGENNDFIALQSQSRRDRSRLSLVDSGINDGTLTFIVPKITLAWLLKTCKIDRVDLLKIDVEGYEDEVLRGAGDALRLVRNVILEILPSKDAKTVRAIEKEMHAQGFRMFDVEGAEWSRGRPSIENNVWARRQTI